jgi:hypothetical protein
MNLNAAGSRHRLFRCSSCGHVIAETASRCVGCGTLGPIARHPNTWRTAEPFEAIAAMLSAEGSGHSGSMTGSFSSVGESGSRPNANPDWQQELTLPTQQQLRLTKFVKLMAGVVITAFVALIFVLGAINDAQKSPASSPDSPAAVRLIKPADSPPIETPGYPTSTNPDSARAYDSVTTACTAVANFICLTAQMRDNGMPLRNALLGVDIANIEEAQKPALRTMVADVYAESTDAKTLCAQVVADCR